MKDSKHRLGNAETPTLCPTKVLNELSLYKNYDKISFRLPLHVLADFQIRLER